MSGVNISVPIIIGTNPVEDRLPFHNYNDQINRNKVQSHALEL